MSLLLSTTQLKKQVAQTYNKNSKFLHSIHWFRAIAILLVVGLHTIARLPSHPFLDTFLRGFFINATFFFVFISGFLFWHLVEKFRFRDYLWTKFKFVVSPYLIWLSLFMLISTFASFLGLQIGPPFELSFDTPFTEEIGVIWHFWVGGSIIIPFWFIPVITLVFLSAPFIIQFARSHYFYPLALTLILISLFTSRASLDEQPYLYPFVNYLHFIGVYFFGILVKKHQAWLYEKSQQLLWPVLFLYLCLHTPYILSDRIFDSNEWQLDFDQLKMYFGVIFFLLALFHIEKHLKEKDNGVISHSRPIVLTLDVLARYSFGIFFFHTFALTIASFLINPFFNSTSHVVLQYFLLFLATLFLSIGAIFGLRRVFKSKSKVLIGS